MDRDLVERAMAGDHDAFSELARISIGRLYVIARLILRDAPDARVSTAQRDITSASNTRNSRQPAARSPASAAQRQRSSFQSRPASSVWQLGTGARACCGCGRHARLARSHTSTSIAPARQSRPS